VTKTGAYRWVIVVTASLGMFMAMGFGRFAYSAILPSMQQGLGLSAAEAGSLASWNLAGYTAMALGGGFLASRFGPRVVIATGLFITAAGLLLIGASSSLAAASAFRLLSGMGNGMVIAPSIGLMAAWFDREQRGLVSSIVASSAGYSLMVVGPVVPRIIASGGADGWRIAWYFLAGCAFFMAVVAAVMLRNRPRAAIEVRALPQESILLGLKAIVRSGYAWHMGLIYFFYGIGHMTYLTFFQKRLINDLGYSSETAGYIFLAAGIACAAFGLLYGVFSDRRGRGLAIAVTLLLQGIAALLFALPSGTALLVLSAVLCGSGAFSVPGLMGAACGDHFGARLAPAALGFVTVFIGVGQAVGPYVAGALADAESSFGPPYLLCTGAFIIAAAAALLLGRGQASCTPSASESGREITNRA
jgi:sugar phosphate permease